MVALPRELKLEKLFTDALELALISAGKNEEKLTYLIFTSLLPRQYLRTRGIPSPVEEEPNTQRAYIPRGSMPGGRLDWGRGERERGLSLLLLLPPRTLLLICSFP